MKRIKEVEIQENSNRKLSRFLTYFISICVFSFSLFLLTILLPAVALLSTLLAYIVIIFFSLLLSLLFIFLLDRSECKTLDFILLPVILSTTSSLLFGFLKYMGRLVQFTTKALSDIPLKTAGNPPQYLIFPNINLIFILFMIFFNAIFLYKYLQSPSEKKYILLYLIPIFSFILISIVINIFLQSMQASILI